MKVTRVKILFTIFIFSAVAPSAMQAKDGNLSKTDFLEENQQAAYSAQKELLVKVDKQELVEISDEIRCCLVSLEPELVQQVRNALKVVSMEPELVQQAVTILYVPDSLIEKVLILGMKYKDSKSSVLAVTRTKGYIPYAILVDDESLAKRSPFEQLFTFFHEGGHVRADFTGESDSEESELNEVLAEVYAIDAFAKLTEKNDFKYLLEELHLLGSPRPYFNPYELVCCAEQLFAARQKREKLDVLTYARKIVADRKKDCYEQEVEQKAKKVMEQFR